MTLVDTQQQINSLLYYLTQKTPAPFGALFDQAKQAVTFDYSENSLIQLTQFLLKLWSRYSLSQVINQADGKAMLFALAAYLGNYLARQSQQTITWYDYTQVSQLLALLDCQFADIITLSAEQTANGGLVTLVPGFMSSLTARIGDVYYQPLSAIVKCGTSDVDILATIQSMQAVISQQSQINLLADPNDVAQAYLAMIKANKLTNSQIGYLDYFTEVIFDDHANSLQQIDAALLQLKQHLHDQSIDYRSFISQPANQALCYFLGFYIGTTSSQLAKIAVKWVNYTQMRALLDDNGFVDCIEHSFLLLMEDCYLAPIAIVTNRLFNVAPQYPDSAVNFAKRLQQQPATAVTIFYYQTYYKLSLTQPAAVNLPGKWQPMIQAAAKIIVAQLQQICQLAALPTPTDKNATQIHYIAASTQNNTPTVAPSDLPATLSLDQYYQLLLDNPNQEIYQVLSYSAYVNLPSGRANGLVIELRYYEQAAPLSLQLILPYKSPTERHTLVIYPILSHQIPLPDSVDAIIQFFYQQVNQYSLQACEQDSNQTNNDVKKGWWDEYYVDEFSRHAIPAKQQSNEKIVQILTTTITLASLPISAHEECNSLDDRALPNDDLDKIGLALNLTFPPFDYASWSWQAFDMLQAINCTIATQPAYLQVVASDALIKDELFEQVQALNSLYQHGQVTWAVVIKGSPALYQPVTDKLDDLTLGNLADIATIDVVYDLTQQASVEQLQKVAHHIQQLASQDSDRLTADDAFIALHLQSERSRLSNHAYRYQADRHDYRIATLWVWREHLPNGLLAQNVIPIILPNKLENGFNATILPAWYWPKALYRAWLAKTCRRFGVIEGFDNQANLAWQAEHGCLPSQLAPPARVYPKFKLNAQQPSSHLADSNQLLTAQNSRTKSTAKTVAVNKAPMTAANITTTPTAINTTLQQQLAQDKVRLTATLRNKQRTNTKLYYMLGTLMALLLLGALSWLIMHR